VSSASSDVDIQVRSSSDQVTISVTPPASVHFSSACDSMGSQFAMLGLRLCPFKEWSQPTHVAIFSAAQKALSYSATINA
jgi:hypothetical protein